MATTHLNKADFIKKVADIENNSKEWTFLGDKPALMIPKLVFWAFARHHRGITRKQTETIYEWIRDKNAFIAALAEMYAEAVNALVDDGDEEGNANWTLS